MAESPRVVVVGASGYAGAIAAALVWRHPLFELAAVTAGLYLIMSYPLAILARILERRLAGKGGRP